MKKDGMPRDLEYLVLLYYCYTPIEDSEQFREEHHLVCLDLQLRGRIIIAPEGINGTVSGLEQNCADYMRRMKDDPRFETIEFKVDRSTGHTFQKLNVRCKDEIVNAGLPGLRPPKIPQNYVEPDDFKKLKDQKDVVVVDVRSNYEHKLGKFKNAITLDLESFREFPKKVSELEHLKDKKVITYCTGGIKCEKASTYLLEQGFKDVYQLHGGIIKYGLEAGGEDFEGKCYVFDNRLAVDVNRVNPRVVSTCHICGDPCDRMINCANPKCNLHVPMCEKCGWEMDGACSDECRRHPLKRHYDGKGYYPRTMNGYNPRKGLIRPKKQPTRS